MRRTALAVAMCAVMLLCGCSKRNIQPSSCKAFAAAMRENGFCEEGDGMTSDSEDGDAVLIQAKNGWLAGFYECESAEVAKDEFHSECSAAGIETFRQAGNDSYGIGELTTEDSYYYYVYAEDTCLFMIGRPEDKDEMHRLIDALGYTEE